MITITLIMSIILYGYLNHIDNFHDMNNQARGRVHVLLRLLGPHVPAQAPGARAEIGAGSRCLRISGQRQSEPDRLRQRP